MMKLFKSLSILVLGLFVIVAGCVEDDDYDANTEDSDTTAVHADNMGDDNMRGNNMQDGSNMAVAVLNPTEGNNVSGTVTFEKVSNGVRVSGEISGLQQGKHGFHIHQYGDCSAANGTSAGGHFNPAGNDHGARTDSVRHMGDMGNITVGSNGNASVNYVDSVIKMNKIMGRGVIVHSGEDDLTSQPTGAAGQRLACGVIGVANADAMMQNENMQEGNN